MTALLHVLSWMSSGAFALIGVLAIRDYRRARDRPHAWLAAALGLLAIVSVLGRVQALSGHRAPLLAEVNFIAFMLCGYALLEYRSTIVPLSSVLRVCAAFSCGGISVALIAARFPRGERVVLTTFQAVLLDSAIVLWCLCVLEPAVRFLIASRRKAPIERTRLRLLAGAYSVIAFVLLIATAAGRALGGHPVAGIALTLVVLASAPALYAGVSPPSSLRTRWLERESERLARSLLPVGSWYWDVDAQTVVWSEELFVMFGLEPGSMQPSLEALLAFMHPDDHDAVERDVRSSFRSGAPLQLDTRFVTAAGEVRWLHARGEVMVDPATRRPTAVFGIAMDITNRKQAEAAVNEGRAQLAEAQRLAHVGSFSYDVASAVASWSDEMFRICGLDPHQDSLPAENIVHPDDRHIVNATRGRAIDHLEPFEYECRIIRPDGQTRWLSARGSVVAGPNGKAQRVHGMAHDITDRRRADEALRRSEEHFRRLVEAAPDAMMVIDETGHILLANDEASRLFGYDASELLGMPVETIVPDELQELHVMNHAQFPSDVMGAGHDLVAVRKDGSSLSVDVGLSPIRTHDGLRVVAAVRDITVRRQAEQALVDAYERQKDVTERLRSVDQMKDRFLEAVSHELRTPLTIVVGLGETLERDDLSMTPEETRHYAHRLVVNAHRLQRLLADLLDLDRMSRGVLEPQRRPTDMYELTHQLVADVEVGEHRLELDVEPIISNVSRSQVERILENLIVNACRHTPADAPIWVRIHPTADGVLIAVEDAGHGVPDESKLAIFEPFRQGESRMSRSRGTGIGLALVAQFAQLHGGRVWVEDRPGGGARFCVCLPNETPPAELEIASRQSEDQRTLVLKP